MAKPIGSISLDLDNKWSYMKTHGDAGWEEFPSFLDLVVPRILDFLQEHSQKITFFVVGPVSYTHLTLPTILLV